MEIFEKQLLHFLLLGVLLAGLGLLGFVDGFREGSLWGLNTLTWAYLAVGFTVLHQVYVWICWRVELNSGLLSKWFGNKAFSVYAVLFFILIVSRPVLITFLAMANRDTILVNYMFKLILLILLTVPSAYLGYSVARYFGIKRAFGIDHFDASYSKETLVKKGIFRYTDNGMYLYGFLALWIPGVLFGSIAGLALALFSHLYIWVHYFCTEKPDMEFIYGSDERASH